VSEPLVTTRPIKITPAETPAPPWTGVKFRCRHCSAEYQLEAGDKCVATDGTGTKFKTPACFDCNWESVIQAPEIRRSLNFDPPTLSENTATAAASPLKIGQKKKR